MKPRIFKSRALETSLPKSLRSQARLDKLHHEEKEKQKREAEEMLEAERRAGLRV